MRSGPLIKQGLLLSILLVALSATAAEKKVLTSTFTKPAGFEPNLGQAADNSIRYLVRGRGYQLALKDDSVIFALSDNSRPNESSKAEQKATLVGMRLAGLDPNRKADIQPESPLPGRMNYFQGKDRSHWTTNVPIFGRLRYREVYPGIDLLYYRSKEGELEHDFIVAPGADPKKIAMEFGGISKLKIDVDGDLMVSVRGGAELRLKKPIAYQETADGREVIDVGFKVRRNKEVSFAVGEYDRNRKLVIDPVLIFSTYWGGSGGENAVDVALDDQGNTYIVGMTGSSVSSSVIPFPKTYSNVTFGSGAFITKFSSSGAMVYSSVFNAIGGGSVGQSIVVDGSGQAVFGGYTNNVNYPVVNGYSNQCGVDHGGAIITKVNTTGDAILYSTCLSGSGTGQDSAFALAIDGAGKIYVGGYTTSTNFQTTAGAMQTSGSTGAFVAKVDPSLTGTASLLYSTIFGGQAVVGTSSIAVAKGCASNCSAYVTGSVTANADGTSFPTTAGTLGATVAPFDSQGKFLSKINPTGTGLDYSTYLITNSNGQLINNGATYGVAVDAAGNAYVTGYAVMFESAANLKALPGPCPFPADQVGWVAKVNATASAYAWQGCLNKRQTGYGIDVDSNGNIWITGIILDFNSNPYAYPVTGDAFQSTRPTNLITDQRYDGYVQEINNSGTQLLYASYISGDYEDTPEDITVNGTNIAVVGTTKSRAGFPVLNAAQPNIAGDNPGQSFPSDAFVLKLSTAGQVPAVSLNSSSLAFGNQPVGLTSSAQSVTLSNTGNAPLNITSIVASAEYSRTITCGSNLLANSNCSISVTFTPVAQGSRPGTLTITDDAAGSPHTVTLSGTGVVAPSVTLSPPSLTFASQVLNTTSPAQIVTLGNNGNAVLNINSINITGDFARTTTCGSTLNASATCTISITFTPTAAGNRAGTLTILDNAAGSPHSIGLTGVSGNNPVPVLLSYTPASAIAGGSAFTLTLNGLNFVPGSLVFFNGNFVPSTFVSSTQLTVAVAAATIANPGTPHYAVITNAPGGGVSAGVNFPITAGPNAVISLSAGSVDFGPVMLRRTSPPRSVVLTNSGTATMNLTNLVVNGDYQISHNCGSTLAAAANCTAQISLTPTATGTRNGTLTISDSAPSNPHAVSLLGNGLDLSLSLARPTRPGRTGAGPQAFFDVELSVAGGKIGPVTLTCDGAPLGVSCKIDPTHLMLDGSAIARVVVSNEASLRSKRLKAASKSKSFPITVTASTGTLQRQLVIPVVLD